MVEPFIGAKVKYWRQRRGKTQRVLAGLAGISQPYLSQIESGIRPVDRRATLVALAGALQVTVTELTGQPGDPTDPARAKAAACVPAVREALIMREAGEREAPPPSAGLDLETVLAARARYDFAAAAPPLPGLLAGATNGTLVQAGAVATSVLRHLGYEDLARDAASLCVAAGRDTDDPAWIGIGERLRVHCLPFESRMGLTLAARAAEEIQPRIGEERTRRAYGMLHLEAALRAAVHKRASDAAGHLAEAEEVADSLGEPQDWTDLAQSCFGPANVTMWKVPILAELGDRDQALAAASAATPERIPFKHRQASFLLERMAILADAGRDADAAVAFLRAETLAPQFVRLRPAARETITVICRRAQQRAVSGPLRRAAEMFGLNV